MVLGSLLFFALGGAWLERHLGLALTPTLEGEWQSGTGQSLHLQLRGEDLQVEGLDGGVETFVMTSAGIYQEQASQNRARVLLWRDGGWILSITEEHGSRTEIRFERRATP